MNNPTKLKQASVITWLLKPDENTFVPIWIADKIIVAIGEKRNLQGKYLK